MDKKRTHRWGLFLDAITIHTHKKTRLHKTSFFIAYIDSPPRHTFLKKPEPLILYTC
jgi:hypothetical protein